MYKPTYYCSNCGHEVDESRGYCQSCGTVLEARVEGRRSAAIFLNELANLVRGGVVGSTPYEKLRAMYIPRLGVVPVPVARPERPVAPTAAKVERERRPSPVPAWLVQQAPNLLLYLGAFLTVIAALVFVSARGGDISGGAKLAMLVGYTTAFTLIGAACYRVPRIRVAGYTFVALSALLVPLNFAAAYNFVLEEQGVNRDVVWLAASVYAGCFYVLLGTLGLGRLYGFLANAAVVSAVASTAELIGVPVEWRAPIFAALGIGLLPVAWYAPSRLRETFQLPSLLSAHFLIAASVAGVAIVLSLPEPNLGHAADLWTLPVTLAFAGAFLAIAGGYYRKLEESYVYGYGACAAVTTSLASALVIADCPFEWIPAAFVPFASALFTASLLLPERFKSVLGDPASVVARLIAVGAAVAVPILATSMEDADRIAVPVTLVLALGFFLPLSLSEKKRDLATCYEAVVLALAGGALLSVPFVLEEDAQYYSAAFAGIAGLYVAAALAPVKRSRYGSGLLWVFALVSATAAWVPFLGSTFDEEPWFGAGATWVAGAIYLLAALAPRDSEAMRALWRHIVSDAISDVKEGGKFEPDWVLLPAFAAMVGLGFAYFLQAVAPEMTTDSVALRFLPFPLVFAVAGAAVSLWSQARARIMYIVAFGYSMFVTLTSPQDWGQMALFLAIFAVATAVIAAWERAPRGVYVALGYAVFAIVFALIHWMPDDEVWPMPFVVLSLVLYAAGLAGARKDSGWSTCLMRGAFAVALVAPVVGFGLLQYRVAEQSGDGFSLGFSEPPLYLWSTGAVAVLGAMSAMEAVRQGSRVWAYGSSLVCLATLLLGIGYLTPDNPQAYTVPIGLYLLGLVWSASTQKSAISGDAKAALSWVELLAAGILLGTTLLQALDEEGLSNHFLLLGESIAYLIIGLVLRRKLMVVPGLAFATIGAALFAFEGDGGGSLPPWAILAIVGGALLALGFLFLVRLDFWQRLQQVAVGWWRDWGEA